MRAARKRPRLKTEARTLRMPYGKYKGEPVIDLPTSYIRGVLQSPEHKLVSTLGKQRLAKLRTEFTQRVTYT